MVKKVLSIAAAAAITATGVWAFDAFDDGVLPDPNKALPYDFNTTRNLTAETSFNIAQKGAGDALIFPAYFVGNGWQTTLRVINTSPTNAVVAKVVFYSGKDSKELLDFNIYLSANDVWVGTLKIDADGKARVISSDDSSPLPTLDFSMASADNPFKSSEVSVPSGYVEVIGCAMAVDGNHKLGTVGFRNAADSSILATEIKNAQAHKDHQALRKAYNDVVHAFRNIPQNINYLNGVIRNTGALAPDVNLSTAWTTSTNIEGDYKKDYAFGPVDNALIGDVRITDTKHGKDMVMPAIVLTGVTIDDPDNNKTQALLYAEGEAANIADRALTGVNGSIQSSANNGNTTTEYHYVTLKADMEEFNTTTVWMTYGDSTSYANNQLVLTSPYKRLAVFADANISVANSATQETPLPSNGNIGVVGSIYADVKGQNYQITDFGYYTADVSVYNESEDLARDTQFSPANSPKLKVRYEVGATEGNTEPTDNLSFYLSKATANTNGAFNRGYAVVGFTDANGDPVAVPAIPTQMIATDVDNRIITNWIVPAHQ